MKVVSIALSSLVLSSGVNAGCPFGGEDAELVGAKCPGSEVESKIMSPASWTPTSIPATPSGCECTTTCQPSDAFALTPCDWCKTAGKCGSYKLSGLYYWDYCTYPEEAVSDYEAQSHKAKHDYLWKLVEADPSDLVYPNLEGVFTEDIQKSFDINWDWMNEGRKKYIHGVGAMCQVDMVINSTGYTGVLEKGTASGFMRMASAVDSWSAEPGGGPVPGIGFKFLRTNVPSANWVTLHQLGPPDSGTFNPFEVDQNTHIPPPTTSQLGSDIIDKFKQGTQCPLQVGLSDAASYTQDGERVAIPVFPYMIKLLPADDAASYFKAGQTSKEENMAMYESMPKGTALYTVMMQEEPGAEFQVFGKITTTSECTSSDFGDNNLFFRHQRMEEDWARRPNWIGMVNMSYECSTKSEVTATGAPALCYL